MNEGWIRLHRKFLEWEWFEMPDMVKLFIYFLLKANYIDKDWKGVKVKRGQFVTGRKQLSDDLRMSEQKVRTCIDRLRLTGEITIKTTNKFSVVTVSNYDDYNIKDDSKQPATQPTNNQQITNKQPTNNQQITTTKNKKNIKNGNKKSEFDLIFEEFVKMRIKIRKPMTDYAKELILKKLEKLADDEAEKILILKKSIERSWQGVFPLKEDIEKPGNSAGKTFKFYKNERN